MLVVSDLVKQFGDRRALDGVSFQVEAGEVVGFLGPNGAGKTTTMRIINAFLPPTSGSITVGGLDVQKNSRQVRRQIGYLPESTPLYMDMRVEEYLTLRAKLKDVPRRGRARRVEEVMETCWLRDRRRQLIGTLSKGYRQRVGLADALVGDAKLLVLDEPTIGLDPIQIREVRSLIAQLIDQRDRSVLISTHILSEVEQTCDRVVIINEGRVVASTTVSELLQRFEASSQIQLELSGADEAGMREAFSSLPGVVDVARDSRKAVLEDGWQRLTLSHEQGADLRDAVFGLVAEKGWLLREMAVPRLTLEEVFIRLTRAASPRGDTPVEEVAVGVSVAASSESESGRSSP